MQTLRFSLDISPQQYEAWYRGSARRVHVRAEDGRSIQFPAEALQPYLLHNGIRGRFEICFDQNHKLQE